MDKRISNLLQIARDQIGVTEWPKNSNKVLYNTWYYDSQVSGSGYPWCMAFVQWCFNQNGTKLPYKTASCSALLNWYKKNKPKQVFVINPKPGDVVIYNFGHTGIVESWNGYNSASGKITAIEGNTSSTNKGSQDNGGGVFRRIRAISTVTAFIRPIIEEEEELMTGKQILDALTDEQAYNLLMRARNHAGKLAEPAWSKDEGSWKKAEEAGVISGRPEDLLKRDEFIAVLDRNGLIK